MRKSKGPEGRQWADRRMGRRSVGQLQVDPLRQGQRILYVDAEVAHRAVHLRVAQQQLDGAQVAGRLVYHRHSKIPNVLCDMMRKLSV